MLTTTRLTSSCCTPIVMTLLTQNGVSDNTYTKRSAGASVTFRLKSRMTRKCHVRPEGEEWRGGRRLSPRP